MSTSPTGKERDGDGAVDGIVIELEVAAGDESNDQLLYMLLLDVMGRTSHRAPQMLDKMLLLAAEQTLKDGPDSYNTAFAEAVVGTEFYDLYFQILVAAILSGESDPPYELLEILGDPNLKKYLVEVGNVANITDEQRLANGRFIFNFLTRNALQRSSAESGERAQFECKDFIRLWNSLDVILYLSSLPILSQRHFSTDILSSVSKNNPDWLIDPLFPTRELISECCAVGELRIETQECIRLYELYLQLPTEVTDHPRYGATTLLFGYDMHVRIPSAPAVSEVFVSVVDVLPQDDPTIALSLVKQLLNVQLSLVGDDDKVPALGLSVEKVLEYLKSLDDSAQLVPDMQLMQKISHSFGFDMKDRRVVDYLLMKLDKSATETLLHQMLADQSAFHERYQLAAFVLAFDTDMLVRVGEHGSSLLEKAFRSFSLAQFGLLVEIIVDKKPDLIDAVMTIFLDSDLQATLVRVTEVYPSSQILELLELVNTRNRETIKAHFATETFPGLTQYLQVKQVDDHKTTVRLKAAFADLRELGSADQIETTLGLIADFLKFATDQEMLEIAQFMRSTNSIQTYSTLVFNILEAGQEYCSQLEHYEKFVAYCVTYMPIEYLIVAMEKSIIAADCEKFSGLMRLCNTDAIVSMNKNEQLRDRVVSIFQALFDAHLPLPAPIVTNLKKNILFSSKLRFPEHLKN